jgi:mono/diheme cytochrome c family protein
MEIVQETYQDVWAKWDAAYDEVIAYEGEIPPPTPERIAHGRTLFMDGNGANCLSCHGEDGRGAGPSAFESRALTDEDRAELAELDERIAAAREELGRAEKHKHEDPGHYGIALGIVQRLEQRRFELANERVKDDWGNEIAPRDLNRGVFRFGRRPIDLYRRIHAGINGTPMPSHAAMKDANGERILSDEDLWDLVHYIRSLSAEEMHASSPSDHDPDHDHGI